MSNPFNEKTFVATVVDSRPIGGAIVPDGRHVVANAGNKGPNDPNAEGQGPRVPSVPTEPSVHRSDQYPSSSPRIAAEFMSQGRPAPQGEVGTPIRAGDMSASLAVKTPQFGTGFYEWAVKGYDLAGSAKSGESNRSPEPGNVAVIKANIPVLVTEGKK